MKPRVRIRDGKQVLTLVSEKRPNPEAIRCAETLLERAKSGDLISFVYAAAWTGDWTSHAWAVDNRTHKAALLGECQIVVTEYQDSIRMQRGDSVLEDL